MSHTCNVNHAYSRSGTPDLNDTRNLSGTHNLGNTHDRSSTYDQNGAQIASGLPSHSRETWGHRPLSRKDRYMDEREHPSPDVLG
ncbi:hypothetical protein GQ53DRAFT_754472 [Thozetella sp. PMI_491]|nr:hypothetical protein GQ53DRAFT_754472 [Thozetella sp. PMI_491]